MTNILDDTSHPHLSLNCSLPSLNIQSCIKGLLGVHVFGPFGQPGQFLVKIGELKFSNETRGFSIARLGFIQRKFFCLFCGVAPFRIYWKINHASSLSMSEPIPWAYSFSVSPLWCLTRKKLGSHIFFYRFNFVATNHFEDFITTFLKKIFDNY